MTGVNSGGVHEYFNFLKRYRNVHFFVNCFNAHDKVFRDDYIYRRELL